jgi:lambda repressor-like predicted transcriptional regulator
VDASLLEEETLAILAARHADGETLRSLSREFGVHVPSLSKTLRKRGYIPSGNLAELRRQTT